MASSPHLSTNMTCVLKLDTQSPGWHGTINKVLKKIQGVNYSIDVEQGMAYISGRVDPQSILRLLAKAGKHADLSWVEAGKQNLVNPLLGSGFQHHQYQYQYPPSYPMTHFYPPGQTYYSHGLHHDYPSWA